MARGDRRKCKCCLKLFRPDPRNRRHQRYCSAPRRKAASKAASKARWLAKPENHNYFCGEATYGGSAKGPCLVASSRGRTFSPVSLAGARR
jgi:hypothetical protein